MSRSLMNYVRLLFLLAIPVANIAALEPNVIYEIIEGTPSMIRGGSFGEEHDAHGRELLSFSWSWTNLLFHLGVCHAHANCTMHHPGPCGCPDCNKPHPPHFQNDYCSKEQYSAVSDGESEEELEGDNYGEDGARGEGQQPTRMLKMFAIIAAAAAATVAIGAFVMRKRNATEISKDLGEFSEESGSNGDYKLMGGMTAAFAVLMAKMGMKQPPGVDDASTTSGSSGLVSKRMSLLQRGDAATVGSAAGSGTTRAPSFIAIQTGLDAEHDMMQADEGIEVEGPYRPSTQYAI